MTSGSRDVVVAVALKLVPPAAGAGDREPLGHRRGFRFSFAPSGIRSRGFNGDAASREPERARTSAVQVVTEAFCEQRS